ncbi:MAG: dTDP-4-amino-4,6-dideoxygalactose transaminase [Candidatus Omnitrophota bacterium]|jgi:dTDP-4-amino-4,6-dideoxygalactose transaminase
MNVPFIDLKAQANAIRSDLDPMLDAVMQSCGFILGQPVTDFEQAFSAYSECAHGIGCASGLDALKLALRAFGVGPGDEVITAANTFIATTLAVSSIGAIPVLVDMDGYFNLDVNQLEAAITPKTKVIIPVHLYGQTADMDPINAIAAKHGIHVIEDASQAHGARYKGKRAGAMSGIAAFSMYPGKNLGAFGDAGVMTTRDDTLAEQLRVLRNYGSDRKYYHQILGENSRLDSMQAAVVLCKLKHLDDWNTLRRAAAAKYSERLAGVGDLVTPKTADFAEHVFHLYVVRTGLRDALMTHLQSNDIGCIIHYPVPIHKQEAYADMGWKIGDFPETEKGADEICSLPIFPHISDDQIDYVCETIRGFFA